MSQQDNPLKPFGDTCLHAKRQAYTALASAVDYMLDMALSEKRLLDEATRLGKKLLFERHKLGITVHDLHVMEYIIDKGTKRRAEESGIDMRVVPIYAPVGSENKEFELRIEFHY